MFDALFHDEANHSMDAECLCVLRWAAMVGCVGCVLPNPSEHHSLCSLCKAQLLELSTTQPTRSYMAATVTVSLGLTGWLVFDSCLSRGTRTPYPVGTLGSLQQAGSLERTKEGTEELPEFVTPTQVGGQSNTLRSRQSHIQEVRSAGRGRVHDFPVPLGMLRF